MTRLACIMFSEEDPNRAAHEAHNAKLCRQRAALAPQIGESPQAYLALADEFDRTALYYMPTAGVA